MTRYVVKGEHTLGYIKKGFDGFIGVLASKPQLGGTDSTRGYVSYAKDEIRDATPADFEFFRVDPKGCFPPEQLHSNPLWGTF